jgi:lipopolysaccharide biosynthesis protein
MLRDNIGFDFGGWSDALLTDDEYTKYDRFLFVNSSVIGPYLPGYYRGRWTDIYLHGLQGNVKLFGSTINTIEDPVHKAHVQSYIFAMDRETLDYLIECEIFSKHNMALTFQNAVDNKEILMSRKIIERGWNIGSLLPCFKSVDFTSSELSSVINLNDIMYNRFRNVIWNEYDLVFIKGNRRIQIGFPYSSNEQLT